MGGQSIEMPAEPQGVEQTAVRRGKAERSEHSSRQYLAVPYADRKLAKRVGARWDAEVRAWYVTVGSDPQLLFQWWPDDAGGDARKPEQQLAELLKGMGGVLGEEPPKLDSKPHMLPLGGSLPRRRALFYIAHGGHLPHAYVCNLETRSEAHWVARGYTLSGEQRDRLRAAVEGKLLEIQSRRVAEFERVATRVEHQLVGLQEVKRPTQFHRESGIRVHTGLLVDEDGRLYIPATDETGRVWSAQIIERDGKVRFLDGGRLKGCFHVVGGAERLVREPVLVIAESYRCAATLARLLNKPVVAAFVAENLEPVAVALHGRYMAKAVLIAGSDESARSKQATSIDRARVAAERAARAVGGRTVFPVFAPTERLQRGIKPLRNFHDLATRSVLGAEAAARQVEAAYFETLKAVQVRTAAKSRSGGRRVARRRQRYG